MLAHSQGGLLNAAALARGLGIDGTTVARYLDLMVDLLLVRRLPPWHKNVGKRLVKSPRVFVRDSGVTHALLGLDAKEDLLGHPVVGHSWEGFVIENLLAVRVRDRTEGSFYRSSGGAEIDLVVSLPGRRPWAIEIKRSLSPKPSRGFHHAWLDVNPEARICHLSWWGDIPRSQPTSRSRPSPPSPSAIAAAALASISGPCVRSTALSWASLRSGTCPLLPYFKIDHDSFFSTVSLSNCCSPDKDWAPAALSHPSLGAV